MMKILHRRFSVAQDDSDHASREKEHLHETPHHKTQQATEHDEATPSVEEGKQVFLFKEGSKDLKMLLGGKGANLCEMTNLGLPVPAGFVISTQCCKDFFETKELPTELRKSIKTALHQVELEMCKHFGVPHDPDPLLLSVRSGAPASMPGMMDTVLNLGLNDDIRNAMIQRTGNARWAFDTHRRFIQMFSNVVMGIDGALFEKAISELKEREGVEDDTSLTAENLEELLASFRQINPNVPENPFEQLWMSIEAVFRSWYNARAVRYRAYNNIPESWGTAVNVQSMVFGNLNEESGTGVAFTRNPATGENVFFGEFLENAEGEDVVAGIRTPKPLSELQRIWPDIYEELDGYQRKLELHYRDMQDLEFTIENSKLFMLQCRNGKRTAQGAVRMACDMVEEGLISTKEAVSRCGASQMDFFLHSSVDPQVFGKDKDKYEVLGKGLPASPGAATGQVVLTPDGAEELAKQGKKVILVRKETTPEDIHGMKAAQGILTQLGGMTSHAAVVARGMGTACVSGCGEISVDVEGGTVTCRGGEQILREGDVITIDGARGMVLKGEVPRVDSASDQRFQQILEWADSFRDLRVMANADTPEDAKVAHDWGAEGIGLCRTEHMFFDPSRIDVMRMMIMSQSKEERLKHLAQLEVFQRDDMTGLLKEMDGLPVTVRLLDPPLHEFLPKGDEAMQRLAELSGKDLEVVKDVANGLEEVNPMLGFRGCRLSVVYPEISLMQVRAIAAAAVTLKQQGLSPKPEIMVPVVSTEKELKLILPQLKAEMEKVFEEKGERVDYELGTMIELPRACLMADTLTKAGVSFMSFGTNDLTQTTWGFSRDDIPKFLGSYVDNGVLAVDPFSVLDQRGVGQLIKIAVEKARAVDPNITLGICGEHGGEPTSVTFFDGAGFNYVSCSPLRVPIARIAAAQAAILRRDSAENEEKGAGAAGAASSSVSSGKTKAGEGGGAEAKIMPPVAGPRA